jgi:NAD(P)-dependent dehydrogenase (short-subunit alcohol dehydrogenase family)
MTAPLALITGGGTGIGRATAERLLSEGWRVTAVGLDCDDDLPAAIRFHRADVIDTAAILPALAGEKDLHGFVHCAGILRHEREWQVADFDAVMQVNVSAGFALANALLPRLETAGGAMGAAVRGRLGHPLPAVARCSLCHGHHAADRWRLFRLLKGE